MGLINLTVNLKNNYLSFSLWIGSRVKIIFLHNIYLLFSSFFFFLWTQVITHCRLKIQFFMPEFYNSNFLYIEMKMIVFLFSHPPHFQYYHWICRLMCETYNISPTYLIVILKIGKIEKEPTKNI